jgi:hypothetical protein
MSIFDWTLETIYMGFILRVKVKNRIGKMGITVRVGWLRKIIRAEIKKVIIVRGR